MLLKKTFSYFVQHPELNALAHFLIGLGLGVLLGPWVFDPHPIRWAVGLISLGVLIHIYPLFLKK